MMMMVLAVVMKQNGRRKHSITPWMLDVDSASHGDDDVAASCHASFLLASISMGADGHVWLVAMLLCRLCCQDPRNRHRCRKLATRPELLETCSRHMETRAWKPRAKSLCKLGFTYSCRLQLAVQSDGLCPLDGLVSGIFQTSRVGSL